MQGIGKQNHPSGQMVDGAADEKSAFVTRKNEQSRQLYFLFKGVEHKFMMNPLSFLSKTGLLDRNLVMLRDSSCGLYHGSLAKDICGFQSILARLRDYRQQYSYCTEMYCAGTSAGAYASIVFGYYLEVDVVTAFAPATLINVAAVREKRSLPSSWTLPERHGDLEKLLAQGNGKTKYRLYYCQDCLSDRNYAERLAHCPGVSLYPQPGDGHNVVEVMDDHGGLESIFSSSCRQIDRGRK